MVIEINLNYGLYIVIILYRRYYNDPTNIKMLSRHGYLYDS